MTDFVLSCVRAERWTPSTLQGRLGAIRAAHITAGLRNPLEDMHVPYMAIAGYRRRTQRPGRRHPVTTAQLRWLWSCLQCGTERDHAVLWAALLTGWFFLLRASEYVGPVQEGRAEHRAERTHAPEERVDPRGGEGQVPQARGLRGCDLQAFHEGRQVTDFAEADEVRLCIRGSKVDQLNQGHVMNHFRTHDPELCVIEALGLYQQHAPEQFGKSQLGALFTWASGKQVTRKCLQQALVRSAEAMGLPADRMASHSLRFGGATAIWAAYKDSALVKRWGRWSSDAFHGYLWEDKGNAKGVAEAMAKTSIAIM